MLTLYTTPLSANGRKVLALCAHLGLAPAVHTIDVYRGQGRSPEYLAINPSGKIPTLTDGPVAVFESNAILMYLSEAHADCRFWSREPVRRSAIARWLFWEASEWQPALIEALAPIVGHRLFPASVPAPARPPDWHGARLAPAFAALERALAGGGFVAGSELTLAEFAIAGMTTYFRAAAFPFAAFPVLASWYQRIEALPAWRATEAPLWAGSG